MPENYMMCARAVKNDRFIPEPGPTLLLLVPEGELPSPKHMVKNPDVWYKRLRRASTREAKGTDQRGDLLIFIHGYNNSQHDVLKRHVQLKNKLNECGYQGEVVWFDWPSNNKAINYCEDRHDAKKTAMQLVSDGISVLSAQQSTDCTINVHLLGHSTGAYVIREAFDDADDTNLKNSSWNVSQVILIGGDISSRSLTEGNSRTDALYRHCVRLTNYSNYHDTVLTISNAKRLGMSPRVGRVGLPCDAPAKAVNVDCTDYFGMLESQSSVRQVDQEKGPGSFCHAWHFGNRTFARDMYETLMGDADRNVIVTRRIRADGGLALARLDP